MAKGRVAEKMAAWLRGFVVVWRVACGVCLRRSSPIMLLGNMDFRERTSYTGRMLLTRGERCGMRG